ncbi:uroporphyrinogen-III synthase [alpha proteobacterium U9-1i]|nr:uroporphyrinogen-III synthase [alpha proteobacterium U9-1i]
MRVAITRMLPEANATAARVRDLGHEALLAPLLSVEPREFDTNLAGAQALFFTSTTGVRAFAQATTNRNARVLAVGDTTADAARAAGFDDVTSASGDVIALAALAQVTLDPQAGPLIHIAGAQVAGDLVAKLKAAGFDAEWRVGYEAVATAALPAAFEQNPEIVLFHSARAAAAFVALGAPNSADMVAACFSEAVAEAAMRAPWKRVIVAPKPREEALLAAALTREGA